MLNAYVEFTAAETALHVMVLYDGLSARILAKLIYDRVCVRLPQGVGARLSLWRFDALRNRRTERLAHHDLTEADVLMVAADGFQPLAQEIQKMLEKWLLKKKTARLGLVGILHGVEEHEKELSPVHSFLHGLARKAKAEFFSQAMASTAQGADPTLRRARPPLTLDFVWDEESFTTSVRGAGWGINE